MREPSDHFMDAFGLGIGSPSIVCSCGRRHYAPESSHIDDAERKEMLEDAKKNPKIVEIYSGYDCVSAREIGGRTLVIGCACGWLGEFEHLLWMERDRVLLYYRKRSNEQAAAAARTAASLAALDTASSGMEKQDGC